MKKTITQAVTDANGRNAKKSTGPRSLTGKMRARSNAIKHGLLTKALTFENEQEAEGFKELGRVLRKELKPVGLLERAAVDDIRLSLWKLQTAEGWAMREFTMREKASRAIFELFAESSSEFHGPLSEQRDRLRRVARSSFECREVLLSIDTRKFEDEKEGFSEDPSKDDRIQVQARLGSACETTLRYQRAWKTDLYRAMNTLGELQRARQTAEKG